METQEAHFTKRTTCRGCSHPDLVLVLDLGNQPLANGFRKPCVACPEERYPLQLMRCPACELVQLSVVVKPEIMYGPHYPYRSGYSAGWAEHCHALAKEIGRAKKVMEIGCLDGVLLRHCRDNGCTVWGFDPSSPVEDVPVIREFWGRDSNATGTPDVILAQNVFGHVDDAEGFLQAAANALGSSDGRIIIECPWVMPLFGECRWDTVYHEHLSYWGVRPLMRLAHKVGLTLNDLKYFPDIHGGTIRYYLSEWADISDTVFNFHKMEEVTSEGLRAFRRKVSQQVDYWEKWFALQDAGTVAGYGASAKFNTFLNALSEDPKLACVFDDSPAKIGLVTPGWRIPVKSPIGEIMEGLDTIIVGAPNWSGDLEHNARSHGFLGEFKSLWR